MSAVAHVLPADLPGTLVVRGDLRSQTGWSRATRALVKLMQPHFGCVFGIDLHYSSSVSVMPAPFRMIGERDIDLLIEAHVELTLLNMCLPHEFRFVPNAHNIGYFFWETDKPPVGWGWTELAGLMDQIWVPTDWQRNIVAEWMRNAGCASDIRVVPWPHETPDTPAPRADRAPRLAVHRILTAAELEHLAAIEETCEARLRIPRFGPRIARGGQRHRKHTVLDGTTFELDLGAPPGPLAFAVQTDVPRKGLPVLISEWLRFHCTYPDAILLLKLSSIDVSKDRTVLHTWLSRTVRRLNTSSAVPAGGILVCYDRLTDAALAACYRAATVFVSASFGEGFGGPIVESLIAGTLPLIPMHTACVGLLPKDYPFLVESRPIIGKLAGELPLYPPAGSWHVAVEGDIARRLSELFSVAPEVRSQVLRACQQHLRDTFGADVVAPLVASALSALEKTA
jgi:hypothetical protein